MELPTFSLVVSNYYTLGSMVIGSSSISPPEGYSDIVFQNPLLEDYTLHKIKWNEAPIPKLVNEFDSLGDLGDTKDVMEVKDDLHLNSYQ